MIRKKSSRKYLAEEPVLIVDNKYESRYFEVSDMPSFFHAGKNMFRLSGNSDMLVRGSIIEIEIMPANGLNPIFHTVNNYTDSANRKLITVWVYPDDMTGLATVTIRGIARKRPGGRRIYGSWAGKPNVKWERTLYVDSNKPNTTPIIFAKQPRITISENIKPYLSESFAVVDPTQYLDKTTNTVAFVYSHVGGMMAAGGTGTNPFLDEQNPSLIPPETQITHFGGGGGGGLMFSSSMLGSEMRWESPTGSWPGPIVNGITLPYTIPMNKLNGEPNTTDYTASIIEVVNNYSAKLDSSYNFEYSWTMPAGEINAGASYIHKYEPSNIPGFSQAYYSMSHYIPPIAYSENTYNLTSYANIILANIDPMCGDVYRIKTSMKSHGLQTWDLLADEIVEKRELLANPANVYRLEKIGYFTTQDIIDTYWAATASLAGSPTELKADSEVIMGGMIISGSLGLSESTPRGNQYVKAHCTKPLDVYRNCEYTISFKARAYGELDNGTEVGREYMQVYISGSGVDYDPIGTATLGRRLDNGEMRSPPDTSKYGVSQRFATAENAENEQMGGNEMGSSTSTVTPTTSYTIPDIGKNATHAYDRDSVVYSFTADHDGQVVPVFAVKFGKWIVSKVSIKASSEKGFTPNHTIIEGRVPQYQEDDKLDFKFEFFDSNGVRAELILIMENLDFAGGNTYINGEGFLGEGIIFDGEIGE